MKARMRSVFGWFRRLADLGTPVERPRKRPVRVSYSLDALERRQVLSTATVTPIIPPIVQAVPIVVPATVPAIGTANDPDTAYVESLYLNVLGRPGNANEVGPWVQAMQAGLEPKGVAQGIVGSLESRTDQVDHLYEQYLHRAPDPIAANWVNSLLAGNSEASVAEGILDSPEYQSAHQDPDLFIRDLYIDVLGRQGNASELAFWETGLAQGLDRQTVVKDFVESPEAHDDAINSLYEDFLGREPEAGAVPFWRQLTDSPDSTGTDLTVDFLSSNEFVRNAI